jgi:hypothetical protein
MPVFIAALLLQYVISTKAGLVNHVEGTANVDAMETVRAGHPISTGADGYVEILLRPGSFLRLGENSEATLNDTDLASVKVAILRGPALIEAAEINKAHPITVTTGNLTTKIVESGIYKFENGVATVLQGKLQTDDSKLTYEKGWQVFFLDNYRARKTGKMTETSLDVYSQTRSGVISNANLSLVSTLAGSANYSEFDLWLFSPYLRLYTFIPRADFRSPYGNRYYAVPAGRVVRREGGNGSTSGTTASNNNPSTPAPVDNNNNSNNGGAPAPVPVVSTPSGQQSAPATYIDSKNSPVGATTR